MIYEETVYRPAGNAYAIVEFGDEFDITLSFRVIALDQAIKQNSLPAVTETVLTHRSLGVIYDCLKMRYADLVAELKRLEAAVAGLPEVYSRILEVPTWYQDPWSLECAAAHGRPSDLEYVAQINNMTVQQAVDTHSSTLHWIGAVGFTPGNYQAFALDPTKILTAPKYPVPRKWTYERLVGLGGAQSTIYPVASPGGYQLLGRTPIEIYDPQQRNPVFHDDPVLPKVGDRHKYIPIGEEEYWAIRRQVEDNTYEYKLKNDIFNLPQYLAEIGRNV